MQEFLIVIHKAEEGGYWAEVPALEGCFAQGETLDEVIADARGAIASHLEALREDGQAVPSGNEILIASVALPAA
jgi:predicted RNase H-like HicB family nuclease